MRPPVGVAAPRDKEVVTNTYIRHVSGLAFRNSTRLDSLDLLRSLADSMAGWSLDGGSVWVRYTRSAAFSGTCFAREGRMFVNIARSLAYPYRMGTHIARAVTEKRRWYKPVYTIELADPTQLAVFVFRHECYHWLLHRAGRNGRQKESMCDRFAARYLVDRHNCPIHDPHNRPVPREDWDFQDVDNFVRTRPRPRARQKPRRQPKLHP